MARLTGHGLGSMPRLFIISGCNGSGKTTASYSLLPEILECSQFVNSDEFAKYFDVSKITLVLTAEASGIALATVCAQKYGVPLLARMPIDPELAKLVDDGAIETFQGNWLDGAVNAVLGK